jgi:CheY-like chemotaxis protein
VCPGSGTAAGRRHLQRRRFDRKCRTHFDLLLTDVVLPGMNGRQLANVLQAKKPLLKVLYVTGYSRNAIVHQAGSIRVSLCFRSPLRKSLWPRAFGRHWTASKDPVRPMRPKQMRSEISPVPT